MHENKQGCVQMQKYQFLSTRLPQIHCFSQFVFNALENTKPRDSSEITPTENNTEDVH